MFKNGLGTEADISKAIDYFKRSAEMNNKNGLYEYGKVLIQGKHIEADLNKGLECIENQLNWEIPMQSVFLHWNIFRANVFHRILKKELLCLQNVQMRATILPLLS